ncbi:hypothetical protein BJ170DRAFT_476580 [Xylariales sp. AK1849]|nr:hypothetical protein BJ170DRAFT_476580 [Xylariales sp. AK1849]
MHRLWTCLRCAGLSLIALLGQEVVASHHDQYQIHRLKKDHRALRGRDSSCQAGWSLCPASVGGDCCPNNYACEATYCYATTAGTTTACGMSGYYNCPLDSGPGACCPTGYICGDGGTCDPPAGTPYTETCIPDYYACPSSLGYGCCPSGMGCAMNGCYSTVPSTYTVTSPVTTTNSRGQTVTSIASATIITKPTPGTASSEAGAVPKLIPSTVSKISAIETSSSIEGGLDHAQLGGIIGGVVLVLITVVVATILIIRRLKKTAQVVERSKRASSAEDKTETSHKPSFGRPTVTEIDVSDDNPLMQSPSMRPSHLRARSDSSVDMRHQSPARSPPLSSGHTTPPAWPAQYNAVPNSDDSIRHPSWDSNTGGYYDPARFPQMPQGTSRSSYESQATYTHGRHWSDASEVSGSADGAHGFSELEATDMANRRRSSSGAVRPPVAHVRRGSDSHQRGRSDSSAPTVPPLGTVSEVNELHGFYGPVNRQVGQTAARLEHGHSQPTAPDKP